MSAIAFLTLGLVSLLLFFGFFQSLVHGFGNLGKGVPCFYVFFGNHSVLVEVHLAEISLNIILLFGGWWWFTLILHLLLEVTLEFL